MKTNPTLSLVNLLEPELCEDCRFARYAVVTKPNGQQVRVIRCTRLDCDNWDRTNIEPIQSIREVDDDE